MSGWGRGWCSGQDSFDAGRGPYGGNRGFGPGRGGGRGGGGRGWRHQYWATGVPGWARGDWEPRSFPATEPPAEMEQGWLEQRAASLEDELEQIKSRLTELAPEKPEAE